MPLTESRASSGCRIASATPPGGKVVTSAFPQCAFPQCAFPKCAFPQCAFRFPLCAFSKDFQDIDCKHFQSFSFLQEQIGETANKVPNVWEHGSRKFLEARKIHSSVNKHFKCVCTFLNLEYVDVVVLGFVLVMRVVYTPTDGKAKGPRTSGTLI